MATAKWVQPVVIALIGAAAVVVAAVLTRSPPPRQLPEGHVLSPAAGDTVSTAFRATGDFANIPSGHHVWLAVEVGNLLWFKEPEIPAAGRQWSREIVHGAGGGPFALCLVEVSAAGQRAVESWLRTGQRTGSYPGLRDQDVPGMARLAVVGRLVASGRD